MFNSPTTKPARLSSPRLLFISVALILIFGGATWWWKREQARREKEEPEAAPAVSQLITGKIKDLSEKDLTFTLESEGNLIDFEVEERTRIYLKGPLHIEDFANFLLPEKGMKKMKVGEEVRVVYIKSEDIYLAQEIWLD